MPRLLTLLEQFVAMQTIAALYMLARPALLSTRRRRVLHRFTLLAIAVTNKSFAAIVVIVAATARLGTRCFAFLLDWVAAQAMTAITDSEA